MKSDPGEYSASRKPPASPTSVHRSGEKKRLDPYEKSLTRRKSSTSSRRPSISAWSWGSLRFIQSMNPSKLLISSHGMETLIRADSDRDRARLELDQPQPVPRLDQVRGRVDPQALLGHPAEPLLVVGPVLEVHAAGEPDPRRVALVAGVHAGTEIQFAAQDVRSPAGVDDPPSGGDDLLVLLRHEDRVPVRTQLDVLHPPSAERVRPRLLRPAEQLVLEPPAVDLVRERVEVARRAELDALGDVRVVAGRQEEAQPELPLLVALEMVAHADHLAVVVGADLDARLADLESRLGRGLGTLVGDQDAGFGTLTLELNRDRQSGESAAEDRNVVMAVRCVDRHRLEHRRRTVVCH